MEKQKSNRYKNRSGDLDASKFSMNTSKGKPRDPAQFEARDKDNVYSVMSHMERTFFIVDLSRLEAEGDTLVGALVLYRPQHELKKSQYEQRCSQVIGLSLCTRNLTGEYPKFLSMRGTGFAIRSLGRTYVMGLSSRVDEPGSCTVEYLNNVYNYFRFYYHSPDMVLQSSQGDWEVFTTAMSSIFNCIVDYITRDQHSVPAMLNPLPYMDFIKKNRQVLTISASRVLKACQNHPPIIGGVIMHKSQLVMSQFPSSFTEMLILVGGKGVELDKRSILEENIAPDKVWVLEVYLTREQALLADDQRKDISAFQASYASLDINPQLPTSTLHWRFQSSMSTNETPIKGRENWKRRMHKHRNLVHSRNSGSSKHHNQTDSSIPSSGSSMEPVASSTPQKKQRSSSNRSADAVVLSPGKSSVHFDHNHIKTKHKGQGSTPPTKMPQSSNRRESSDASLPNSPNPGNEADELYLDAVDVDPTMAIGPEMLRLFSRSTSRPEDGGKGEGEHSNKLLGAPAVTGGRSGEVDIQVRSTGSTSSEGFATPSPTPPRSSMITSTSLQVDDSLAPEVTSSFKTACESSLYTTTDEDESGNADSGTLTRQSVAGEQDKKTATGKPLLASPTSETKGQLNTASPASSQMETASSSSNRRRSENSVSDDDFVDSEDLDELLKKLANKETFTPLPVFTSNANPPSPSRTSATSTEKKPPTPPPRNHIVRYPVVKNEEPPPPIPPRGTSGKQEEGAKVSGSKSVSMPIGKEGGALSQQKINGAPVRDAIDNPVYMRTKVSERDYEAIDEDEKVQDGPKEGTNRGANHHPHPVTTKCIFDDRDYEEIDDEQLGDNMGNGALYLEPEVTGEDVLDTEDTESKSSSVTVTLDLSHITKDDIMYGSREIKKMSSSVDIPKASSIHINGDNDSSEEGGGDGTVTPIEAESVPTPGLMKQKLEQNNGVSHLTGKEGDNPSKLNDSGEYSSLPDDNDETGSVFISNSEPEESMVDSMEIKKKSKTWQLAQQTMERKDMGLSKEKELEKHCLYVQQNMDTFIICLADPGLQKQHGVLNKLWRSLTEQLFGLEMMMDGSTYEAASKITNCVVTYSGKDRMCEAQPRSAAYHFRHAVRRAHQEYREDPFLRQISLSKEHCRLLTQRVHEREIYIHPSKLTGDALSLHGALESYAKVKCSLRQQPIGGPKIMFI